MKPILAALAVGLLGCASVRSNPLLQGVDREPQIGPPPPAQPTTEQPPEEAPPGERPQWSAGHPLLQFFLGTTSYTRVTRTGGSPITVEGESGGLNQMALFGGGAQWKLGGESVDYGMEGFLAFEGRTNAAAVATGGGASVPVDVNLYVGSLYGGPFVSKFLGEKLRAYASAGALLDYADYEQHRNAASDHATGFGGGGYVRAGIEWVFSPRTMLGLGARWSDVTIGLDNNLGEIKKEGYQFFLTFSRGI